MSLLRLVAPSPALLVQQPRNLVRAGLATPEKDPFGNWSTAARMEITNRPQGWRSEIGRSQGHGGGADDDKPPMRQVAVASYAVGTHTAAGGLDEDGQKTAQSGPTTQACSVLTVPWSYTVHSSTSSLQESCLACTSFPLGGLEEGPNGPDDQADSRWLPPETTTTRAQRMDLPARPHLISLLEPSELRAIIFAKCSRRPGQGSGEWPPAACSWGWKTRIHVASRVEPVPPGVCVQGTDDNWRGAGGRGNGSNREGIQLELEAP